MLELLQHGGFWLGVLSALAMVGVMRLCIEIERSRAGQNIAKFLAGKVQAAYGRTPKSAFALAAIVGWGAALAVTCMLTSADITRGKRVVAHDRDVLRHQEDPGDQHHRRGGGKPGAPGGGLEPALELVYGADTSLASFDRFADALPGIARGQARPVLDSHGVPPRLTGGRVESRDVADEAATGGNHHAAQDHPADRPPERPQDQAAQQHQHEPRVSAWNIHEQPPFRSPAQDSAKAGA